MLKWVLILLKRITAKDSKNNEHMPCPSRHRGYPKLDSIEDALNITYNALQEGAIGVDMGRNIWQSEHPVAMIQAIHGIVKNGLNVKEALELYDDVKN